LARLSSIHSYEISVTHEHQLDVLHGQSQSDIQEWETEACTLGASEIGTQLSWSALFSVGIPAPYTD